ncbi:monovalent cation/H(+) antiporter subunit G [Agarilytica rhodophyticola]|uniref:monovalent cation/H(+) antiporter subunit G n=1 Tax=Agarilytica rhodophyticola TaxID=1737490 RepID=UPI000B3473BA|nr:monovalent cation/H(+) antiporter subunit G [Agarilytica rhodophyticola]
MVLDIISWVCLVSGGFLCITGGIGLFRFPDFFSRMHAASITDTLGSGLIMIGLLVQVGEAWIVAVKLLLIILFIFLTSPTSSHALAKAALHSGLKPYEKQQSKSSSE